MKKCMLFKVTGEGEVTVLQTNCWKCVLQTDLGKIISLKQFLQGYYKDLASNSKMPCYTSGCSLLLAVAHLNQKIG